MSDALLIARSPLVVGFVETWTLHDPASRNALSEAMVEALFAALCTLGIRDDSLLRCYPWRAAFLELNRARLPEPGSPSPATSRP